MRLFRKKMTKRLHIRLPFFNNGTSLKNTQASKIKEHLYQLQIYFLCDYIFAQAY